MVTLGIASDLDNFHLDIFGQGPRINRLYTQITLCFPLPGNSSVSDLELINIFTKGIEQLSANFPWVAGKVVNEHGSFKIKPFENTTRLVVKDYRNDRSAPTWDTLRRANFPFSMLDECIIAPRKTLAVSDVSDVPNSELPVFLIQVNFITSGLLLTINGQHGSMDMTGQGQIMHLFAKACRNEPFTPSELSIGNMDRKNIIDLLDDDTPGPELDHQILKDTTSDGGGQAVQPQTQPSECIWAYFTFPATSLAALKSLAMKTIPSGSNFVSTDDVLSAFIWQSITRVRLPRLGSPSTLNSALSRNVDARRYLSIPSTYPGFITSSTLHTSAIGALVKEPLGSIAAQLRSALDPASIRYRMRASATRISNYGEEQKPSVAATSVPELDIRLSSWAKENCYDLDFGFGIGKPEAVRRPRFAAGAREGLVYFLPRALDGEIAVGVCLRDDDLERLKADEEFTKFATYIG
jgi:hypothetical protein